MLILKFLTSFIFLKMFFILFVTVPHFFFIHEIKLKTSLEVRFYSNFYVLKNSFSEVRTKSQQLVPTQWYI